MQQVTGNSSVPLSTLPGIHPHGSVLLKSRALLQKIGGPMSSNSLFDIITYLYYHRNTLERRNDIAEFPIMKTFRIDERLQQEIQYLQSVYTEWNGYPATESQVLRVLITDAVIRINSIKTYNTNTRQESTDELGK